MRILLIDDESYYYKLLDKPLRAAGYELEFAKTVKQALALIASKSPELIIVDLGLPDAPGFDVLERVRRDPGLDSVPVIMVTASAELNDKLKAFELGADDYLVKPFQPEELVARLRILAQRGKALKMVEHMRTHDEDLSSIIAFHSLRGGVGCTSLAVNLAIAYYQLWGKRTLLVDAVLSAGQVAMMLNAEPGVTWENCVGITPYSIPVKDIERLMNPHKSGIYYAASPRSPLASNALPEEFWRIVFDEFKRRNEMVIVDLAHDFSDLTIDLLNKANQVLLVLTPDVVSVRAAVSALEIYGRLGYPEYKIKIVLNQSTHPLGISQAKLEKALEREFDFLIPYEPKEVLRALNFGVPFVQNNPDLPVSAEIENMAYALSSELLKNLPPVVPTSAWKRVTGRLARKKSSA